MVDPIISLTKQLVALKTAPDNATALNKSLELIKKRVRGFTVEEFESNGYRSLLIYNTAKRPKRFGVLLNGHLDIIPGKDYQYTPQIKGNKLYGVGVIDMKSSVASFIEVFKDIAHTVTYPLGLQFVTDEELGGFHGTKHQIDQGVRADFVIVGETTNFMIENETKGIIWLKIATTGKTAHGAYPWAGENAIWKMNKFLTDLNRTFPSPKTKKWMTTINLARIETSNQTFNKIPDTCEVWLDIRFVPEEKDTVLPEIKALLPKGFTLEKLVQEPAQFVPKENSHIRELQRIGKSILGAPIVLNQGQGSSDARHFTRVGCDAIEFGPRGEGMGTDNEWVEIDSLAEYAEIIKKFLLEQK